MCVCFFQIFENNKYQVLAEFICKLGGGNGITGGEGAMGLTGKFLLTYQENRGKGKKKKENGAEKKENQKRESGKLKMEGGKVTKWGEVFFFSFSFHFSKPLIFVLSLPKWEFSTGKKHFTPGKKSGKMTLPPPPEKYSSYAGGGANIWFSTSMYELTYKNKFAVM